MTETTNVSVNRVLIGFVTVLSVMVVLLIWLVLWEDDERRRSYEDAALLAGLARLNLECRKEGIAMELCDTMVGSVFVSDTGWGVMWKVRGITKGSNLFVGSVMVDWNNNGDYEVVRYHRET